MLMRTEQSKTSNAKEWIATILFNLMGNILYLIPAIIALVLHFVWGISLWWTIALVILWIGGTVLMTYLVSTTAKSAQNIQRTYPRYRSSNGQFRYSNNQNPSDNDGLEV